MRSAVPGSAAPCRSTSDAGRLGAEYVARTTAATPVMLHRAISVRWSASSAS
jgi:hypothetical protein